jgi:hypothetical protein
MVREHGTVPGRPQPAEQRPPVDRDYHTADLPPLPQRAYLIPATRWIEAPAELVTLGDDLGIDLVAYKRRIGRYLLWRAGPASGADARYCAIAVDDLDRRFEFRLFADGTGEGEGPDGVRHARFRTWKEALRDDASAGSGCTSTDARA